MQCLSATPGQCNHGSCGSLASSVVHSLHLLLPHRRGPFGTGDGTRLFSQSFIEIVRSIGSPSSRLRAEEKQCLRVQMLVAR